MCLLCKLQLPLNASAIMTSIQFALWLISVGVLICSAGRFGGYVEKYMSIGLSVLCGVTILVYVVMLGIVLSNFPNEVWSNVALSNLYDLFITDYEWIAQQTPTFEMFDPSVVNMKLLNPEIPLIWQCRTSIIYKPDDPALNESDNARLNLNESSVGAIPS